MRGILTEKIFNMAMAHIYILVGALTRVSLLMVISLVKDVIAMQTAQFVQDPS